MNTVIETQNATDEVDCSSAIFAEKIVFDSDHCERPPWNLHCISVERSLAFCLVHYTILLLSLFTCGLYVVSIKQTQSDVNPLIWSVISFCIGCLLPAPSK